MVAFLVRVILKGGIVVRVVDGEVGRRACTLGNGILCKAETVGVVIAAVVLELVIVLAEGGKLAAVGKKGVLNVFALAETSLIAVVAGSFTGTSAAYTVHVVNAERFYVRICLLASAGMNIDRVISLSHADVIRSCTAQRTYGYSVNIVEHSHHTGNTAFGKRFIDDRSLRQADRWACVGVVVYHNTVRTQIAFVLADLFARQWIDRTAHYFVLVQSVAVDIGRVGGLFFILAAACKQA